MTSVQEKRYIYVYDVGSTYTKLALFEKRGEGLAFLGRSQAPTTVKNITEGLSNARYNLMPVGAGEVPQETYASSSAAGGLRMVAMGYMPRVTAKAAKEVAMNAGARVLEIVSHEDPDEYKVQVLREINPDIILLAGGTDGGDEESLLENAGVITASRVKAVVIIAGNIAAQPKVEAVLKSHNVHCIRVPNVMPPIHELRVKPARQAIHEQFIRQITKAQGLHKLLEVVSDGRVTPTPGAVLLGAELLALGTPNLEGTGDLVVVDVGGATTDVHSILPSLAAVPDEEKGLVVHNEKQTSYRTVEGNLGLRVSAKGIVETVGVKRLLEKVGLTGEHYEEKLLAYTNYLEVNPDHVACREEEVLFDEALAIAAVEVALKRHAGFISQEHDPVMGIVPGTPVGRDLRKVKKVIAVGGIFTHSEPERAERIIRKALEKPGFSLIPTAPEIVIDKNYLMYATGILAGVYPDEALSLAKTIFSRRGDVAP